MKMKNIKTTLVTQNIDGLHNINNTKSDDVYEIHGNGRHMRCWNSECQMDGNIVRMNDQSIMEQKINKCNKCE